MNFKPILFSQFITTNQTLSENLQPVCNFLLYICPRPTTFKGWGGDKNINSHPHSEPQKNSVNFWENINCKLLQQESLQVILTRYNFVRIRGFVMERKIIRNRIKCKHCGDIIESISTHDFKFCSCGKVAIDGGKCYLKRTGNPNDWEELSEFE